MNNEIKFVKFGDLENKKDIENMFAGIKESDLIYLECDCAYVVTELYKDGVDIISTFDKEPATIEFFGEFKDAWNNSPTEFTIYAPAPAKKEAVETKEEKKEEEKKVEKKDAAKEKWEAEIKEKAKAAKKEAKRTGLPALRGTTKQKAWAETIRAEKIAMLKNEHFMIDAHEVMKWYIKNYKKASQWIDVRFKNKYELKENMKDEIAKAEIKARISARRTR